MSYYGPREWFGPFIGGQAWTVYLVSRNSKFLVHEDGRRLNGRCEYARCRIYINRDLDDGALYDALLHEFLHALLHVTGAETAYDGDHDKDEHVVAALTPALHRLLLDMGFAFPSLPSR
jgi:hypothetical protein